MCGFTFCRARQVVKIIVLLFAHFIVKDTSHLIVIINHYVIVSEGKPYSWNVYKCGSCYKDVYII